MVQDLRAATGRGGGMNQLDVANPTKHYPVRQGILLTRQVALACSVDGAEVAGAALRMSRRCVQVMYQDPYASLNRRLRVTDTGARLIKVHGIGNAASCAARVHELLGVVGLAPCHADRYRLRSFAASASGSVPPARGMQPGLIVPADGSATAARPQLPVIALDLAVVRHMADRAAR